METYELRYKRNRKISARLFLYRGSLKQHGDVTHTASTQSVQQMTAAPSAVNHQSVETMEASATHAPQGASLPVVMEGVRVQVGAGQETGQQTKPADDVDRGNGERLVRELEELRRQMNAERENMDRKLKIDREEMKEAFREELNADREQMDRKLQAEREQMDRKLKGEREQMDRKLKGEREQMERKLQAEREEMKEAFREELKAERQQMDRKLQAEREQMDRKLEAQREHTEEELERRYREEFNRQLDQRANELEGSLRGEMGDLRSESMDLETQVTQAVTQLKQQVTQLQTCLDTQGRMHTNLVVDMSRHARDEVAGLTDRIQALSMEVQHVQTQLTNLARAALGGQHLFVDNPSDTSSQ